MTIKPMTITRPLLLLLALAFAIGGCAEAERLARNAVSSVDRLGSIGCTSGDVFCDDFDSETAEFNHDGFAHWRVIRGSVDVIATDGASGLVVDLDGTTRAAGRIETRRALALSPGEYRLSLTLSRNPIHPGNRFTVRLGSAFAETISSSDLSSNGFQTVSRTIRVSSPQNAVLSLDHEGGDDFGIYLDSIRLTRL